MMYLAKLAMHLPTMTQVYQEARWEPRRRLGSHPADELVAALVDPIVIHQTEGGGTPAGTRATQDWLAQQQCCDCCWSKQV